MSASRLRIGLRNGRELQVNPVDARDFQTATQLLHDWYYGNSRGLVSIDTSSGSEEIYLADIEHVTFES